MAKAIACARFEAPSLLNISVRRYLTVLGLIPNSVAISDV